MKKTLGILFAFAMILSLAFIGDAISSSGSMSAKAQVTVRRRRTGGVVGGTRYVAHKTKRGAKYVAHKTVRGTVYVGKKTYQGGKYVGKKTVQGTRYTSHKVKRGTKATVSRTKKIILGNN